MRFMIIIKASQDSEAGVMPSQELLTAMGNYNEELVKAGIMLAGEGLHPSSKGARVKFSGGKHTVIDGPFIETKELIAGFWLWKVKSKKKPSNGSSAAPTRCRAPRPRSRFARCLKPKILVPSSHRNCASRKSGFGSRRRKTEPPGGSEPARSHRIRTHPQACILPLLITSKRQPLVSY